MKRKYLRGGSLNCAIYPTVAEQSSRRPVILRQVTSAQMPFYWTGKDYALVDSDTYDRWLKSGE